MKATPDTLSHNPTGVLSTLRHVEMWTAIRNERHVALISKGRTVGDFPLR